MVLKETLQTAINSALKNSNTKEGMNGVSSWNGSEALASFIVLIIIILFILIIGKFLWNVVLCRLLTIAKPADSIWQILGLAILLNLIYA
jgi:glucan phosphoethanolaminetransferase (alkaline phosphatase superfamily)